MTNQQNMDTQNNILQDRITEFEKTLAKCLLNFDNKGVKEAHSKIKHIKDNFLNHPLDFHQLRFQELLDEFCSEECGFDEHIEIRTQLGECYLYGRGVKKDVKVGLELLEGAASLDSHHAMFFLRDYYSDIDERLSLRWAAKGERTQEQNDYLDACAMSDEIRMAEFIHAQEKNNHKVAC